MIITLTAPRPIHVELECDWRAHGIGRGRDSALRQHRPAKIGMQYRAGKVKDATQARCFALFQSVQSLGRDQCRLGCRVGSALRCCAGCGKDVADRSDGCAMPKTAHHQGPRRGAQHRVDRRQSYGAGIHQGLSRLNSRSIAPFRTTLQLLRRCRQLPLPLRKTRVWAPIMLAPRIAA